MTTTLIVDPGFGVDEHRIYMVTEYVVLPVKAPRQYESLVDFAELVVGLKHMCGASEIRVVQSGIGGMVSDAIRELEIRNTASKLSKETTND